MAIGSSASCPVKSIGKPPQLNSFAIENRREREIFMQHETLESILESEGAVARRSWYRD